MKNIVSLISGIIFSVGLILSGMTNPKKVIGFLDIFGEWDYSLALVMGGAVTVNFLLYRFILEKKPIFDEKHFIPVNLKLDRKLFIGAAIFGVGWGLVGICPGPGIVNLVTLNMNALIFILSMTFGMIIFKMVQKKL